MPRPPKSTEIEMPEAMRKLAERDPVKALNAFLEMFVKPESKEDLPTGEKVSFGQPTGHTWSN